MHESKCKIAARTLQATSGLSDRPISPDEQWIDDAVQGAILAGEGSSQVQDLLLLDVTPLPIVWSHFW